ncbi:MAG: FliM/FliN family flagellar motor switch protein [Planctomycetales bacterium]|nr:FliM/FliN family flagellar motor switch protein [Planctomycetales bacterium]
MSSTQPEIALTDEPFESRWTLPALDEVGTARVRIVLGRVDIDPETTDEQLAASPLPLDRRLADPVEIEVDGRLIGYGEVFVHEDKLAIRVLELLAKDVS